VSAITNVCKSGREAIENRGRGLRPPGSRISTCLHGARLPFTQVGYIYGYLHTLRRAGRPGPAGRLARELVTHIVQFTAAVFDFERGYPLEDYAL